MDTETTSSFSTGKLVAIGSLIAVIVLAFVLVHGAISAHNTGNTKIQALNAAGADAQNQYSAFVNTFYDSLHLANAKSDKLDKVLKDAVTGRYDTTNTTAKGPSAIKGNSMFSAMVEAYPDLKQLDVYDKVIDVVVAGRARFRDYQSALRDRIRDYETFTGNFPTNVYVSLGFVPTGKLEARVGSKVWHGQAALDKLSTLLVDKQTTDAYTTGHDAPLDITK